MPFIESIFWLALNLYHECRGEPLAGQIAVAHVVMNRAEKRGKSLREIVLQPYQFSWANGGARPKITEYEALCECFEAAVQALGERLEGKSFSHADHYHEKSMSPSPSWTKDMAKVATVGNHIFYRS